MSKRRRSSPRVGKKHREKLAALEAQNARHTRPSEPVRFDPPRVVIPPVFVRRRICRVVIPVATIYEVQEWSGSYWMPSDLARFEVEHAPRAPRDALSALGVPREDWDPPLVTTTWIAPGLHRLVSRLKDDGNGHSSGG